MASSDEKKNVAAESNPALSLIDPVYEKYVKSVIRALGSSQFYEYFKNHKHDLVFTGYDKEAVAVVNAAIDNNIKIPEEMEVIGFTLSPHIS